MIQGLPIVVSKVEYYFGTMEIDDVIPAAFRHEEWREVLVAGKTFAVSEGKDFLDDFVVRDKDVEGPAGRVLIPRSAYDDGYDAAVAYGTAVWMAKDLPSRVPFGWSSTEL